MNRRGTRIIQIPYIGNLYLTKTYIVSYNREYLHSNIWFEDPPVKTKEDVNGRIEVLREDGIKIKVKTKIVIEYYKDIK